MKRAEAIKLARVWMDWRGGERQARPNIPSMAQSIEILARALLAEVERSERIAAIVQNLSDDVEQAVHYLQARGKGGQHTGPTHAFASFPPSALSAIGRYARELRIATSGNEVVLAKESQS